MDMMKGLQWFVLIFVFYFFIIYQFLRIIYRKLEETNIISRGRFQRLDEMILKFQEKFKKLNWTFSKSKNMI